ncbi:expressed protein [Phakopsora pachyrhizi]|uniref:Expressed protein n=1 Tax=Phakopsora pachyrhizi TaxID=170000 RepID=A0AAV0BMG6_PHAPC|nr:expressed protein [Phakopsora pachyrhizi]
MRLPYRNSLSLAIVCPQHSSNQSGHNSIPFITPPNLSLSSQVDPSLSNSLPPATQHMQLSINQTRPGPTHSANQAVSPIRLSSATYPSGNHYAPAVFYSSNPHGSRSSSSSNVTYNQPQSLISPSSSGDRSPISPSTPKTPISPSKFGYTAMINSSSISHSNPSPQSHSSASQSVISNYSSAPTTATATKAPFYPVIVPVIPGIGNSVSTPLPGQVQPEEVRKSAKTQPPVVNTGNSCAMIPQPGDWMVQFIN